MAPPDKISLVKDLKAKFIKHTGPRSWREAETMREATGLQFLCPKCFVKNGGSMGTHQVLLWSRSRGAPEEMLPGPGRWTFLGTSLANVTVNGDPPGTARSVLLRGGCRWHGYVDNGYAHGDLV